MVGSGFLRGFSVYINPNLLGLLGGAYAIEVSLTRTKREVVAELARLEEVVFVDDFHGPLVGMAFVYENERSLQRFLSRVDRIARAPRGMFSRVPHPPCTESLTPTEWTLLARLARESFSTYGQLATELGIPVRTLKRRLAKFVRTGAILTFPSMDYRAIAEGVPADLMVSFGDRDSKGEARSQVLELIGDWMIYAGVWEDFEMYRLILPKLSQASEFVQAIEQIEGIARVRAELVEEHINRLEALRPYVERRMAVLRNPAGGSVTAHEAKGIGSPLLSSWRAMAFRDPSDAIPMAARRTARGPRRPLRKAPIRNARSLR